MVLPQLSCGNACQVWLLLKRLNCRNVTVPQTKKTNEHDFSGPHLEACTLNALRPRQPTWPNETGDIVLQENCGILINSDRQLVYIGVANALTPHKHQAVT